MKNQERGKVMVIGSGVGGLATAVRLQRRGYQVTVFEANSFAGGKASRIEKDGFTWGFGPSLFTLPELLDEIFELCGRTPADYYQYQRLDPICNYLFADGTKLKAWADRERFAAEVESQTGEAGNSILAHLKAVEEVYELTKDIFLFKSVHKVGTYLSLAALKALLHLGKLGINEKMDAANRQRFSDPRLVQLFNRYATYNGSDPYKAPSTLNVIAHPEYNKGAYFLSNGMPDVSNSLFRLAKELGVEFKFDTEVERIEVKDNKARGVLAAGTYHAADIVVSNMDIVYTYRKLLPGEEEPAHILEQPRSSSAIIFYWGINRVFNELDVHSIFFTADYRQEFKCLENGTVYEDPTVYVFISSKLQPLHAPPDAENWFVLINVPHDSGQDWNELVASARRNVIQKINRALNTDIEKYIVTEHVNTPGSIAVQTLSYGGALYGSSSNDKYSAFLRHPNFSRKISNLYFCGGTVHPGGGIPLCLLSAKIIDELVNEL